VEEKVMKEKPGGLTAGETPPTNAEARLAVNLALASRMLSRDGHDDLNQGQVSARLPGSARFLIKNALCGFNEARPGDMVFASVDPDQPAAPLAPPELPLHQAIYAARPDVNAVVHSHAPYTLVFGATDWDVRPISHDGACFQGRLPRFTATTNTVLDIDTGRAVARALGDCPAALLRNHGSVVVGKSLREAAVLAQVLERACRIQIIAEGTGAAYHVSAAEDVHRKVDYIYSDTAVKAYWDYCVRLVKQLWSEAGTW
jgi:L-fuculose-phosphate aldolase